MLAALTERITGVLQISLLKSGEELFVQAEEIIALAYDEWHGSAFFPELLTAFVTPNHPEIVRINARASELLGKWTDNPSLDAYQSRSPDRVKKQIAAVYGAMQEQNIVYSVPPASFEITGQRVRLCDAVIRQHMGTCLDLTLLYASCLEAIGPRPLLILQKGHILLGAWLEDLSFPDSVSDAPTLILEYIIDVHRARLSGIRPLPMRIQTENGWRIKFDKRDASELTSIPEKMKDAVIVTEGVNAPTTKRMQWERKLLDLGLRNTLINMRLLRNVIPVLSSSLSDLEDALASGSEFGIMSRPVEWAQQREASYDFGTICDIGFYSQLIQVEFNNKRLRSPLLENDLGRVITNLYRASKAAIEENGANTLYLS